MSWKLGGDIDRSTYTEPICMAWAASEHGGLDPRRTSDTGAQASKNECPSRHSGSCIAILWPKPRVAECQFCSTLLGKAVTSLLRSKRRDPGLQEQVARSHWRRALGVAETVVTIFGNYKLSRGLFIIAAMNSLPL